MKLNKMAYRREFLKERSTAELDAMLQDELRKENLDDDLIRLILDILEVREADHPIETNEEMSTAVEKYTSYLDDLKKAPSKTTRKRSVVLKVASVLLAVGLLLFAVPQTVQAESFFEMLARWTDSIFEFFNPGDDNKQPEYVFETNNPGLQQIYDSVVELGITDPVVPMWVPEGYELKEKKIADLPEEASLYARFESNKRYIYITYATHGEEFTFQYTKDQNNVEIYEAAGIEHYVLTNNKEKKAVWSIDNTECSIVLDCQEDIYRILGSIYTTEGEQ